MISPTMPAVQEATARFEEADAAWAAELRRVFGKQYRDARYDRRGEGEPGSAIRRLYDARKVASEAFHAAWDVHLAAGRAA